MRELEGKNAVITGANRGIGFAIVQKFAENGCNIWACARKKSAVFEEKISDLAQKNGVIIIPVYFDLSNGEDIKNGFKNIYNNKRPIDVLVNTAGVINAEIFQRINVATMHDVFEINFFGPVQLSQLVLKSMLRYKNGSIINISSIAGLDTNPTNSIYGSSKAALNSFTKILASEVATSGIRVNAIAPGPTDTEMIQVVQNKVGNALLDRCAMGRLARPDEIAETALFLASEKSSFINGQILRVDGGAK
jgi:3-oxoacyl-[acyl-carrier protein] reductase